MDLIMGRFADAVLSELSEADIDAFETLSEVPDPDLYAWLSGGRPVPAEHSAGGRVRPEGVLRRRGQAAGSGDSRSFSGSDGSADC